jgi:hypothetical protein
MFRLMTVVAIVSTAAARADVAPPPGQVRVPVDHVIETDKAYPDYVFVVVIGGDAEWSYKAELSKDRPLRIEGKNRGGRARLCSLAAVPADTAKAYKTDKELIAAVIAQKAKGMFTVKDTVLDSLAVVPEKNAPKVIEEKHRVERITPEEGIVLSSPKVGRADDPDPHGYAEESAVRWALAGVVAALAVCGLGLWLIGRRRGPAV